jgi:hypothetical protein
MKRLTKRYRAHLIYRARREVKRRYARPVDSVSRRRPDALQAFISNRALLPATPVDEIVRPGYLTIIPPSNFCIRDNFDQTLAFILDMRRFFAAGGAKSANGKHRLRAFADFAAIQSIEPDAGLILAAEVDRWRLASGRQPRPYDREWQPAVKRYFVQAGLFELLGISPQLDEDDDISSFAGNSVETLKFIRGFSVVGQQGSELRDRLEAMCGKSIGPRLTVYEAISEAIANTRHAYPHGTAIWPSRLSGRWWASGSWDRDTNTASVHLYDQGVGIPETLPRSDHWSDILRFLGMGGILNPERRDDKLIEAALAVGRTSTGQAGRGKGLAEMARWIDKQESGFLRIASGRGSVTYRPGGKITGEIRSASLPGTLIGWEIGLNDTDTVHRA